MNTCIHHSVYCRILVWFFCSEIVFFVAVASSSWASSGEIRIVPHYLEERMADSQKDVHVRVTLLADHDNISAQLTALQDDSKQELEPLIQRYMHTAGRLTASAFRADNTASASSERRRLHHLFQETEHHITQVLERYTTQIDAILQKYTYRVEDRAYPSDALTFSGLLPGKYRVYVVAKLAESRLQWFEPYELQGGDAGTIILTHKNLHTPYWTELNWWSFMNLDFSKHHPEAMP